MTILRHRTARHGAMTALILALVHTYAATTAVAADQGEAIKPGRTGNLFPRRSWAPPPPVVPPAPAPKPIAPPLPFKYLGQLTEEGETAQVFLEYAGRQIHPRAGETINGTYRIEAITDVNIQFVYLPLDEAQTLNTGRLR